MTSKISWVEGRRRRGVLVESWYLPYNFKSHYIPSQGCLNGKWTGITTLLIINDLGNGNQSQSSIVSPTQRQGSYLLWQGYHSVCRATHVHRRVNCVIQLLMVSTFSYLNQWNQMWDNKTQLWSPSSRKVTFPSEAVHPVLYGLPLFMPLRCLETPPLVFPTSTIHLAIVT